MKEKVDRDLIKGKKRGIYEGKGDLRGEILSG